MNRRRSQHKVFFGSVTREAWLKNVTHKAVSR